MKAVYQCLGLLLLAYGAWSATVASLGASCTSGDTCSVNGAVCDKATSTCQCNHGYVQSGSICSRTYGMLCGLGMCSDPSKMMCSSGQCKCDTSKGYADSLVNCDCPTGQTYHSTEKKCMKVYGQVCSATSECYTTTGMICSTTCTCDSALHRAGTSGGTSCACDSDSLLESGTCKLEIGETCTTTSQCAGTANGVECLGSSGSMTCGCDTAKHYAAGRAGSSSCDCATNYDNTDSATCKSVIGQTCTTTSECDGTMSGVECLGSTGSKTCNCDTTKNYATGTTDASMCDCVTNYVKESGTCKKGIGQSCTATSDCAGTANNVVCQGATGSKTCGCDSTLNLAVGTAGGSTCPACATDYAKEGGTCKKMIGQSCTVTSDCAGNANKVVCQGSTGSKTCDCDSTLNLAAGSTGGTTCPACATGYAKEDGTCKKKIGQACSAASECVGTSSGVICSTTCKCDTDKNLLAGTAGDTSCSCAANYLLEDGLCKLKVDQACNRTAASNPCIENAFCNKATDTCKCDDAGGYAPTLSKTCDCTKTGYTLSGDACLAGLGGFCVDSTTIGVCVAGAYCFPGNATHAQQCFCSGPVNEDGTCSGAAALVASLAVLLTAVLLTSRVL